MSENLSERLGRTARRAKLADEAARDARAARGAVIAEAEQLGWTLAAIAAATGLSLSQVGRIAVSETAQRQQTPPTDTDPEV